MIILKQIMKLPLGNIDKPAAAHYNISERQHCPYRYTADGWFSETEIFVYGMYNVINNDEQYNKYYQILHVATPPHILNFTKMINLK